MDGVILQKINKSGRRNLCKEGSLQKLGLISESKVVQKLSLEKNVFNKKWSPKLIFLDDIFF